MYEMVEEAGIPVWHTKSLSVTGLFNPALGSPTLALIKQALTKLACMPAHSSRLAGTHDACCDCAESESCQELLAQGSLLNMI